MSETTTTTTKADGTTETVVTNYIDKWEEEANRAWSSFHAKLGTILKHGESVAKIALMAYGAKAAAAFAAAWAAANHVL
jgi:hypothetical protein